MLQHRQLHLWITEHDYSLLRQLAGERQETVSCVIRRLIKVQRLARLGTVMPAIVAPARAHGGP